MRITNSQYCFLNYNRISRINSVKNLIYYNIFDRGARYYFAIFRKNPSKFPIKCSFPRL